MAVINREGKLETRYMSASFDERWNEILNKTGLTPEQMDNFISLEGIDGVGKTTQAKMLKDFFMTHGRDVCLTREPGGCRIAEKIRSIVKDEYLPPLTELFMFLASTAQHTEEVIIPALRANKVVICDRFLHSTVAYQTYGRKVGGDLLPFLHNYAAQNVIPTHTVFITASPDAIFEEKQESGQKLDIIEQAGLQFQRDVAYGYQEMVHQNNCHRPARYYIHEIQRGLSAEDTHDEILKVVGWYFFNDLEHRSDI